MSSSFPKTCVTPQGFRFAIHKPSYEVYNLRHHDFIQSLGELNGNVLDNSGNFPPDSVKVDQADWIYEIPNPLPFRGATFISKSWGDVKAANPASIKLPAPPAVSMSSYFQKWDDKNNPTNLAAKFSDLPRPVLLALVANSTDSTDLTIMAHFCCEFTFDENGQPTGLCYQKNDKGQLRAKIPHFDIFEILVNNPHLPDAYKEIMVLRPGAQGSSEIVGEQDSGTHVFEYLRRNSYISGGHYAANMANDAIRYHIHDLSRDDMNGLRHIYYQRTYIRMAEMLDITMPSPRQSLSITELEELRCQIISAITDGRKLPHNLTATLWGWNYGYNCSSDNYRLHASHQMIHQQFSMLPGELETIGSPAIDAYGCGDLISDFMSQYRKAAGSCFFADYQQAIVNNKRIDDRQDLASSLIVYEDTQVMLFVPKAQTSQWELQLMPKKSIGNIIEADSKTRESIDYAILTAMRKLTGLGAEMITVIEFSKRFGGNPGQRLLYSFLPKLPESPGAFSEAQLRWINGHYPEDFAEAARQIKI